MYVPCQITGLFLLTFNPEFDGRTIPVLAQLEYTQGCYDAWGRLRRAS